jgi:ABC-type branched-subunit amino acid transport system substrate-binding protein
MTTGGRAYLDSVNDQGGINGRKIELKTYDDQYSADIAVQCFKKLLSENVFAAALFTGSGASARHIVLAENNKIPAVGFYPGPQLIYRPLRKYVFTARASYHEEIAAMVEHLWNDLGVRKIAVIYQEDAYGADLLEGTRLALQKYHGAPTEVSSVPKNSNEIGPALQKVRAAAPEAVILAINYTPAALLIKQARAAGWNPHWLITSGAGTEAFIREGGKEAEGTIITEVAPPFTRAGIPAVAAYRSAMAKYFPDEQPSFASLRGYIATKILVEGIKRAGKDLTRDGLVAALESMKGFDLGLGGDLKLSYGPDDHQGLHKVFFTVLHDGRAESFSDWKKLK